MKKFSDISSKDSSLQLKKDKPNSLSNDIDDLDNQISDEIKSTILDGEWQIDSIISVSTEFPTRNQGVSYYYHSLHLYYKTRILSHLKQHPLV